jgi:hypothetical protein
MPDLDRMTVIAVLNFYELVASEYNASLLDRKVTDMNLAYAVVGMWDYVRKLVTYLQLDNNAAYFDEWEHLYERHGPTIRAAAFRRAKDESDVPGAGLTLGLSEAERTIRRAREGSRHRQDLVTRATERVSQQSPTAPTDTAHVSPRFCTPEPEPSLRRLGRSSRALMARPAVCREDTVAFRVLLQGGGGRSCSS